MIKYLDFGAFYKVHEKEVDRELKEVFKKGDLILKDETLEFEKRFADFIGTRYCVGVGSGSDALFLTYKALGLSEGDEIITVSHTFVATFEEAVHLGIKPVLIDIRDDGLMDVTQIEEVITPKTKAIVPVHLTGDMCDMKSINELAIKHGLLVIEDASQAVGASFDGINAGNWGHVGCFSFYPAKILGSLGNAGIITTNDENLYSELMQLRMHSYIGKNENIQGAIYGFNKGIDNIQAAYLNVRMRYLYDELRKRSQIAEKYDNELKDLPIKLPVKREGRVYQDYVIRVDNPQNLQDFLAEKGIETIGVNLIPNHFYKKLNINYNLPVTEDYLKHQIRIPCNSFMNEEEVNHVIDAIREFYK